MDIGTVVKTKVPLMGRQKDKDKVSVAIGSFGTINDRDGDTYLVETDDGVFLWTDLGGIEPVCPIRMEIIDPEKQHFVAYFERPGRIEVLVVNGRVIAHVYDGTSTDTKQDPLGAYDGTLPNWGLSDWKA